ncbi:hypothetical protein, partial [Caldivirga sp.]|uniref:hypothetical protein n=1 Tax=Caldivirga sp. TaxID=2080243 RepID=UPI003D0CA436
MNLFAKNENIVKPIKYIKISIALGALILLATLVFMNNIYVVHAQQSYPTYNMYMAASWYYTLVTPWPAPWWNP